MKKLFLYIGLVLFIGAFVGCKKESPTEPKTFDVRVINETGTGYSIYVNDSYLGYASANTTTDVGSAEKGANTKFQAKKGNDVIFESIVNTNGINRFDFILNE